MFNKRNIGKKLLNTGSKGVEKLGKKIKENPEIAMETLKIASSAVAGAFIGIKKSKEKYVKVPDVRDLLVSDAENVLKDLGFNVHTILDKPNSKYFRERVGEVTKISPHSKKLEKGSLIKIYYLDEEGVEESKRLEEEKNIKKENGNILNRFFKK